MGLVKIMVHHDKASPTLAAIGPTHPTLVYLPSMSLRGPATPFADIRRRTPTTLELMPTPRRPGDCPLGRALN